MAIVDKPWRDADLVALDLEGSGPQDLAGEAILEIALVPLSHGLPDLSESFTTLINPGRRIVQKPWISPGLTNDILAQAPVGKEVQGEIERRVIGKILVGHNVRVDWRLLHRHYRAVEPMALIDTLKLARFLHPERKGEPKKGHSLSVWIDRLTLSGKVTEMATSSQPHRALWDTIAAVLLLDALMSEPGQKQDLSWLLKVAGVPLRDETKLPSTPQAGLWD